MTHPRSHCDAAARRAEYERLLDTYGAARRAWPPDAHALYDACAVGSEGALARDRAMTLDDLLSASVAPGADQALTQRILADHAKAAKPGVFGLRRRGVWRLAPAGALAALSAAGFAIGAATAQPTEDALYYANAAVAAPIAEEADDWSEE